MSEMPKEIWCDKTDCGRVVVIDKDYRGGEIAYIIKYEHERILKKNDNEIYLKSMYIERQNAEYYELKKECEDLERRIVKSNNKLVKMEKEKDAEIAELKNEIDELNGQISEM